MVLGHGPLAAAGGPSSREMIFGEGQGLSSRYLQGQDAGAAPQPHNIQLSPHPCTSKPLAAICAHSFPAPAFFSCCPGVGRGLPRSCSPSHQDAHETCTVTGCRAPRRAAQLLGGWLPMSGQISPRGASRQLSVQGIAPCAVTLTQKPGRFPWAHCFSRAEGQRWSREQI